MQQVMLQITQTKSDDENQLAFIVTITQGADRVSTEENLLEQLRTTGPFKKGIIDVKQLSSSVWAIKTSK